MNVLSDMAQSLVNPIPQTQTQAEDVIFNLNRRVGEYLTDLPDLYPGVTDVTLELLPSAEDFPDGEKIFIAIGRPEQGGIFGVRAFARHEAIGLILNLIHDGSDQIDLSASVLMTLLADDERQQNLKLTALMKTRKITIHKITLPSE